MNTFTIGAVSAMARNVNFLLPPAEFIMPHIMADGDLKLYYFDPEGELISAYCLEPEGCDLDPAFIIGYINS
jgi:hypothetical protein